MTARFLRRGLSRLALSGNAVSQFTDIVTSIYRTIEDRKHWAESLDRIVREVGGDKGVLYSHGLNMEDGGLWVVNNIDPSSIDRYARHYGQLDAWRNTADARGLLDGRIRLGDQVLARNELHRTEWYNDFAHPLGLDQLVHFVQPVRMQGLIPTVHFSVFAGSRDPEFDQETIRKLTQYQPHLKQALLLRMMVEENICAASARALVSASCEPALLVDRNLAIRAANGQAEALLRDGVFLLSQHGVLVSPAAGGNLVPALGRVFAAAHQATPCTVAGPCGSMGACFYNITPVSLTWPEGPVGDHALIVVRIPRRRALDLAPLRVAYGLTATEAAIAAALAEGDQIRDIGEKRSLSRETVRTHVKRILQKTGCSRQSDLIRLVWSSFPPG
jgi:DNA-binding CsgD family transcriptional regulator